MTDQIQDAEIVRSPVPRVTKPPVEMDFATALSATIEGKKITRLSWDTNDTFGEMRNNELNIFIRGEYHTWTISPGDITGTDWITLPE